MVTYKAVERSAGGCRPSRQSSVGLDPPALDSRGRRSSEMYVITARIVERSISLAMLISPLMTATNGWLRIYFLRFHALQMLELCPN